MTATLGISTGEKAISLALVVMPEAADPQIQTIPVTANHVQMFAECIGVAYAADPTISTIGISVGNAEHKTALIEALKHEGVENFRIVEENRAVAAYHRMKHNSDAFAPAATVLALGAAAYAHQRGPVRGAPRIVNPRRVPGGPVAAAAAVVVCATAITLGYAQNGLGGSSENSAGGPTAQLPAPPKPSKPRPIRLDVRPVGNVTTQEPEETTTYYYSPQRRPDPPIEVMMPDGTVVKVELPPILEPPRNIRAWLRQFLMPPATPPAPLLPFPSPPPMR